MALTTQTDPHVPHAPPPTEQSNRFFWRWWRKQSPSQQDRYATLGPLISVFLFLAVIIAAFWYLRNEELERAQESVQRDTEVVQQQIRLRLTDNQEHLQQLAREMLRRSISPEQFARQAGDLMRTRPEILSLSWVQADQQLKATRTAQSLTLAGEEPPAQPSPEFPQEDYNPLQVSKEPQLAFKQAREHGQVTYSHPYPNPAGANLIQLHIPLTERGNFSGTLVAEYSLEALLRYLVPREIGTRRGMGLLSSNGTTLTSTIGGNDKSGTRPTFIYDVIVTPVGNGLILRGMGYRTGGNLIGNTLFWMVLVLTAFTVWTLVGSLRHMRRRAQIQKALVQETNFRRAMENSMLTGMRTVDLEGRITYVNPAFCAMTGFSEDELIGCLPPYPYWPKDRLDEFHRLFQQELLGRSPMGGVELLLQRRDGTQFDARMYVSPLIDAQGDQTGWMTSVTNITEAKRVRDQLTAAHERFTTVLEGLDAAVSVVSVQRGELLFANRYYRLWFGANPDAHAQLTGGEIMPDEIIDGDEAVDHFGGLPTQELTAAGSDTREVYMDSVQKWFDVRARYVQWTDGNLAQMLIATDITARKHAEEAAARQSEKSQFTSRLITMGEMASTVAHELNQPLAAISNYCSGMMSRLQAGNIDNEQLLGALDKTSRQAQRAGQIIHRIRQFVKRSEPQRQPSRVREITDAVMELAMLEAKRRRVTLNCAVAQRLPTIMADPILIEQVLLNLLKNAAEAIDAAQMPQSRRHIDLRAQLRRLDDHVEVVEFSVSDSGPGMKEEMLERLFEAFHSTKAEGLGIGLSLCRSIVESHHGRIKAENIYNGTTVAGCRFTFTLPVDSSGEPDFEDSATPPSNDLLADNP